MNCYVVCENVYRDDTLQSVNIIGVGETIEDAKTLIESNREELKRLFDGEFVADYYDDDGSHEFCSTSGVVYHTCACKTKMVAKQAIIDCNHLGNATKIREALENCANMGEQIDYQLGSSEETVYEFRHERCLAHNISECARSALSATPRNCDALSKDEALKELDDRSFSKEDTIEWLYEEAKGETK